MTIYENQVKTQDQALSHLLFHCCFKDGEFKGSEIDNISAKLVTAGLQANLNFKKEVITYQDYMPAIHDEQAYLQYLLDLIQPANELALFSWCAELCISDGELSAAEEKLLDEIASLLKITDGDELTIKKLMAQRKVVETEKIF
jgi:uncharacterized tellurite resistance protein B-like protein